MNLFAVFISERGASGFFANVVLACLIVLILLSTVVMDQNRVRTVVAMKRVETIHKGILAWQDEVADQGGGAFQDGPPVPSGPNDLAPGHPEAAKWLREGDDAYLYSFAGLRNERGHVYPLVSATARDPQRVIAEEIISQPDGTATVGRQSDTGTRVNIWRFSRENPVLAGAILALALIYFGMKVYRKRLT